MQGAHCIFDLLAVYRVYSKSDLLSKMNEISQTFEWNCIRLSKLEKKFIQFHSSLLNSIQVHSNVREMSFIFVQKNQISSKTNEKQQLENAVNPLYD